MSAEWVGGDGKMIRDYNGDGKWSAANIQQGYLEVAERVDIDSPRDRSPAMHEEQNRRWIYPVMEGVIKGIETGDSACTHIGVEFIEEDQGFAFGAMLKSNTARALRRAKLTEDQIDRIRNRVAGMLVKGDVPHEYKEYAKLLRRLGVAAVWDSLEDRVNLDRPRVRRFYNYFL